MRLLLLNYEYPPVGGGAATATREIGRALVKLGHAVTVVTTSVRGLPRRRDDQGIAVIHLGRERRHADRSSLAEMASYFIASWRETPAIAHSIHADGTIAFFSVPCGPVAHRLHRALNVPYVVSLRGADVPGHHPEIDWLHRIWLPLRRRALESAAAVVANSESLAHLARRADGVPVSVVPNGVDTEFFTPPAAPRTAGPFRLLFVGRLHPQKSPETAVRTLAALQAESATRVSLDVVGDGPQASALRSLAASLGVADAVTWHGWLDRAALLERYRSAHGLIATSPQEGMPNAVLEAMACGLPVFASRSPGYNEVVRDGQTGYLFDSGDPRTCVPTLQHVMASRDTYDRLSAAARQVAEAEYSWLRTADAHARPLERGPRSTG